MWGLESHNNLKKLGEREERDVLPWKNCTPRTADGGGLVRRKPGGPAPETTECKRLVKTAKRFPLQF